jgi:hypothetical protein
VRGRPRWDGGAGQTAAGSETGVGALRPPERRLDRPEELLFELVAAVLVQSFVGLTEAGQSIFELADALGDGVEQALRAFGRGE